MWHTLGVLVVNYKVPRRTVTIDLLEHWVSGGLGAWAALGWTLGGPAYCHGLWGFQFQFLPPNLEDQSHALSVPSVHISGSNLLYVQKVGQVLPELVAGGVRGGERLNKITILRKPMFLKVPTSYRNSSCWTLGRFSQAPIPNFSGSMLNIEFCVCPSVLPELGIRWVLALKVGQANV